MKGLYNNQSRKSGGYKKTQINIGNSAKPLYNLSIQCFEGRHAECSLAITFFNPSGECTCKCHSKEKHNS